MDVGLNVDFDGKKNIVMMGDIINVYPVGGMVCEYARLRPTEIKPLIMENPYFHDTDLNGNGSHALMSLYGKVWGSHRSHDPHRFFYFHS